MESKQQLLVGVPAGEGIALDTTLLSEESEDREQYAPQDAPHCSVPSSAPGRLPMRDRLKELPTFMQRQILASFGYKDYTLAARTCPYLHALWTGAIENHRMTGTLFVPGNFPTLQQAVRRVHAHDHLTTIVVGKGEHQIEGRYLEVSSAMNIVGDPEVPKSEIVKIDELKKEIKAKQKESKSCSIKKIKSSFFLH